MADTFALHEVAPDRPEWSTAVVLLVVAAWLVSVALWTTGVGQGMWRYFLPFSVSVPAIAAFRKRSSLFATLLWTTLLNETSCIMGLALHHWLLS